MLIFLYYPNGSTVIESLVDICTTAVSAIQCGKHVTAVDKNTDLFSFASNRLDAVGAVMQKQLESCPRSEVFMTFCGKRDRSPYTFCASTENDIEDGKIGNRYERPNQTSGLTETERGTYTCKRMIANKKF